MLDPAQKIASYNSTSGPPQKYNPTLGSTQKYTIVRTQRWFHYKK